MTTPETIISRLQYDFDCRLTVQQILDIINVLEKRLAVDIVRKTRITKLEIVSGESVYSLGFPASYVTRVFENDREITKQSIENLEGYLADNNELVFNKPFDKGILYVESIIVPEAYDEYGMSNRSLFLGDGHDEIYLYHILSREALMSGNIDMVNNYSILYAEALNSLKSEVLNLSKAEVDNTQEFATKYKNVW